MSSSWSKVTSMFSSSAAPSSSSPPPAPPATTPASAPPAAMPESSSPQDIAKQARGMTMESAAEVVNVAKVAYDDCEHRRMQTVMNGQDSQDYSCEREFAAFKRAFDVQLSVESTMNVNNNKVDARSSAKP